MYLGLDLGTSGLKGLLIDAEQRPVAEAVAPLTTSRKQSGWSEQNPADWIAAAESVLDSLAAGRKLADVRAIGLSGQMHGATLIDAAGEVLRPAILWNDTRSAREAAEMDADPIWREVSGNVVFPGFTAPKLAWVRNAEPRIFEKIAKVLLPKDHLRLWLTGDYASDLSDAAGTNWLDTGARKWSDELLSLSGLSRDAMPRLVEGSEVSGILRPALARRWGFEDRVIVAGGGGDNAASAIGMGVVHEGTAFVSLGTSGVVFAATNSYRPDPATAVHTFCHALPGLWHQMGVTLAATDALNWYARLIGADPAELAGQLEGLRPPGRTLFLPYLGGERTPLNDSTIRGAFLGLEHATDRSDATRAVMEGVAFALVQCRDALLAAGTRLESCFAVGGGGRSRYWLEAIATALALPISVPAEGDFGAAFGAARLGMIAAEGDESIVTPPAIAEVIEPNVRLIDDFADAYASFKQATRLISGK
jgi:xylulokinase